MTRSPYKLLDYYRFEDADLFFGREEETRKMVGEILSSRLLVLFSPSGSGKTSLINAGVRPELEKMGYKTIYTRMEDEPIISVCKAVAESLELPDCQEKEELYEFLKKAAQEAGQPLVIFLDQFEEFFIVFRDQPKLRQEFVKQVARIKYDDQLPIFLVLSLREDYFANLHEFREDIPSIFQNNANIRLEPFTEKAARRAIEEPLKNKDIEDGQWHFEKELVDTILKDLKTEEGIEPIKLQLVCCNLWNQKPGDSNHIPLSTYEALGGAEKFFSNFIYERLSKIPQRHHKLMVRIFESLKTPDNTKRYRSFEDLQSQLNIKKAKRLAALLQQLSEFDLLRQERRKGTHWYEFKHDYVVDEINKWIKERKEIINRKRLLYAVLPGIILFLSLFTYFFIQYNTFYASFTSKDSDVQQEEIVISRGMDPFGERITTGYFIRDVEDDTLIIVLGSKLRLSFWDKNNWKKLGDTLSIAESGKFLYQIGETDLGIKKLNQVMNNRYSGARVEAACALGRVGNGDKKIIDALILALEDESIYVRLQAADSLVRLGKVDKKVIDVFLTALRFNNTSLRVQAVDSLGRLGKVDKKIIDVLLQFLKDGDLFVRSTAADSLEKVGKGDKNVIDAFIRDLEDKYSSVRVQAADSLGKVGKGDKKVTDALILTLEDKSSRVRVQAADSLVRLGRVDNKVIDALILALTLKDTSSYVWFQAASSLARLGKVDKNVIETLLHAMKDENYRVRSQAVYSLERLGKGDKKVINALMAAMKDEDFHVRSQAAHSLVRLGKGDKKVIDFLMVSMENEFSYVREKAVDSLALLGKGDKKVIDALMAAMKDISSAVRQKAGDSLGFLWHKKSETELIELLKHHLSGYRTGAAYALKHKKSISKETLDEINRLRDTDESPWVRLGAWKAFELLQEKKEKEENKDLGE